MKYENKLTNEYLSFISRASKGEINQGDDGYFREGEFFATDYGVYSVQKNHKDVNVVCRIDDGGWTWIHALVDRKCSVGAIYYRFDGDGKSQIKPLYTPAQQALDALRLRLDSGMQA